MEKEKVVIYCRVSSKKQEKEGNGLASQETRCREWCRIRGLAVESVFSEKGISGSQKDRPALFDMFEFLDNAKERYIVLVDDINRLARDTVLHFTLKSQISKNGHRLQSVNLKLEDTEESELMEGMSSLVSQYERKKNAKRTKSYMIEHARAGYWLPQPPIGYKRVKINRKIHLEKNEPVASAVNEALEGFSSARFITIADVEKFMKRKKIELNVKMAEPCYNLVNKMLRNSLYTGYADYKKWDIPFQKWAVDPIISTSTFERIQQRLDKKYKPKGNIYNMKDEQYPLRNWLICSECGGKITGSASTGYKGKRYSYYHCHHKGCKMRFKPQDIHEMFEKVLNDITPKKGVLKLANALAKNLYNNKTKDYYADSEAKKKRIETISKEQEQFLQSACKTSSDIIRIKYEEQVEKLEEEKIKLNFDIIETKEELMPFDDAWQIVSDFISSPKEIWQKGDYTQRELVRHLCFSAPISIDKNKKFRTIEKSPVFATFEGNSGDNPLLAHPRGFEPLTS
ncbi:MAG: recombinase family protein [Alphaproteobacteria bacterium]